MPTDRTKYPPNWKEIVRKVKERSGDRCECMSECGLHTTTGRCIERNGEDAHYARGRVVLTTAHLCHDPSCDRMDHLRHMCNRCHLRYDSDHHMKNAAITRHKKKAEKDLFE